MENIRIYLSGGMTGLRMEEQLKWRKRVMDAIEYGEFDLSKNPIFFNPPYYYSPATLNHKSEREAMEFELNQLRRSDLVIVNFNMPKSIGTAMELAIAREHRIPIIGYNGNNNELHPWLIESCTRMCDDFGELISHVANYYLN